MLPDVNADDGGVGQERVLVGGGDDLETLGLGVVAEPAPAGSLDAGSLGVHLRDELVDGAEVLLDLVGEGARGGRGGLLGASGGKVLPEELRG